jgi:hypothetical protein
MFRKISFMYVTANIRYVAFMPMRRTGNWALFLRHSFHLNNYEFGFYLTENTWLPH